MSAQHPFCLQDLFYITILAALMGYTEPRKELARAKPVGRVLSLPLILSLLLQIAVIIVFQVGCWLVTVRCCMDARYVCTLASMLKRVLVLENVDITSTSIKTLSSLLMV
jgi:hypothetical protein